MINLLSNANGCLLSYKGLAALPPVSVPLEDAGYGGSGGGSPGERHPSCQTIQEQALKPIRVGNI